jgi:hypothetical protein
MPAATAGLDFDEQVRQEIEEALTATPTPRHWHPTGAEAIA